ILGDYRAFDPALGRFLQWDDLSPFGKGGLNGYAYAGNDPVNFWDPTGHYQSVKSKRYGPKPLEAHHHSDGGFWDGFLAGMIHGAKAFYMTPYNYAKGFYEDIAHHHWVGALKMGFDAAVETTIQAEVGILGTMVLQEFITMSPSSIFSGKSPVKTDSTGHRSPYQWGYGLGNEAGGLGVALAVAIVTFVVGWIASGVGEFVDGLSADSASGTTAADANVSGDANTVSRLQNAENGNAHLDQIDLRAHDDLPEDGAQNAARPGAEAEAPSRSQRVLNGLRKFSSWVFRKGMLPHDPEDPFPWDENLTAGQQAKAFVTVTSEALNESRKFVSHLASWGGTSTPQGTSSSGGASWRTNSTPPAGDQGLDPQHQSAAAGQADTPYQPPLPPPPDLPGR
ncbi:MAG: RHS repeat-associated core domain-containing protein, partial [Cyanobacteriota bacterium]|nr:RHS repeat-associated core domain-containing protein [Cyanobacteriota bacterium]